MSTPAEHKELIEARTAFGATTQLPIPTAVIFVSSPDMLNQSAKQAGRIKALELQNRQLSERLRAQDETLKKQQAFICKIDGDFPSESQDQDVDLNAKRQQDAHLNTIKQLENDLRLYHTRYCLAQETILQQDERLLQYRASVSSIQNTILQKDEEFRQCQASIRSAQDAILQKDEQLRQYNITNASLIQKNRTLKADRDYKDNIIQQLQAELSFRDLEAKERVEATMSEAGLGFHAASIMHGLQLGSKTFSDESDSRKNQFLVSRQSKAISNSVTSTKVSTPVKKDHPAYK